MNAPICLNLQNVPNDQMHVFENRSDNFKPLGLLYDNTNHLGSIGSAELRKYPILTNKKNALRFWKQCNHVCQFKVNKIRPSLPKYIFIFLENLFSLNFLLWGKGLIVVIIWYSFLTILASTRSHSMSIPISWFRLLSISTYVNSISIFLQKKNNTCP